MTSCTQCLHRCMPCPDPACTALSLLQADFQTQVSGLQQQLFSASVAAAAAGNDMQAATEELWGAKACLEQLQGTLQALSHNTHGLEPLLEQAAAATASIGSAATHLDCAQTSQTAVRDACSQERDHTRALDDAVIKGWVLGKGQGVLDLHEHEAFRSAITFHIYITFRWLPLSNTVPNLQFCA